MLGQSKPVVLERYGRRRSHWRPPRWLVLLLAGVAVGAGGVVFVQERYLPKRLTPQASAELRLAYDTAEKERIRLAGDLEGTSRQLASALADKKKLADEAAAARQAAERMREDVGFLMAALPPDPRGSPVEVRAARFAKDGGALAYDVVLSRGGRTGTGSFTGVMQLVVAGASARGSETAVTLKPVPVSVDGYQSVRGSAELPDGFSPQQATIQIRDRADGKLFGMRVMNVK
jgi:hypothetical protein